MLHREQWILLFLREHPLDRMHLMKALFLLWYRSKRSIPEYFVFEPYLYGPCSFEVYSVLEDLLANGFVVQLPHPVQQWACYFLTDRGKREAEAAVSFADPATLAQVKQIANEVSNLGFSELLRKVYKEAPEFSCNSVFRGVR